MYYMSLIIFISVKIHGQNENEIQSEKQFLIFLRKFEDIDMMKLCIRLMFFFFIESTFRMTHSVSGM